MTEGDIFRWRYKDEKPEDLGAYRRYHCRSQIAVFENGALRDTYWGSPYDGILDPDAVILNFQGNRHAMEKIPHGERVFYRSEDLVDMRHMNNSRAPIYVKLGARRDVATMKAYFEYEIVRATSDISLAQCRIDDCKIALAAIASGDPSGNFSVYN